jgi:hypothetical protein
MMEKELDDLIIVKDIATRVAQLQARKPGQRPLKNPNSKK